jgi:hypothetical protein
MSEQNTVPVARHRERWLVLLLVVIVILWRSGVLVFWEQAKFDSDQAVIGLMAKHLSEGRALPVFMYGQSYILGVQAWLAAPMFLLFGVSVAALKLPLLLMNIGIAILLATLFERELGLRPGLAAIAMAPFILPAPGTAAHLLEASGGNLEPFLYVLLMWKARARGALCGLIFGIGFLQREFTLYGLLALLCIWAVEGSLITQKGCLRIARLLVAAACVWLAVQGLRQVSSAAGPGTSTADLAGAPNNLVELITRTCVAPSTLARGAGRLLTQHWPQLFGTAPYPLSDFSIESRVSQGLLWASLIPAAAMLLAIARIGATGMRAIRPFLTSICGYLVLIGGLSALAYVAGRCGETDFYTMRYELLSLIGVVALGAWFLRVERTRGYARVWIGLMLAWTLLAAVSHVRFWHEYLTAPPVAAKQEILRRLEGEGVRYGTADYWIAYYITFLSQERIILASSDFVRIRTYNTIVAEHAAEAVRISRTPCAGGLELVRNVYQCP